MYRLGRMDKYFDNMDEVNYIAPLGSNIGIR
jgi:hypothetical protein